MIGRSLLQKIERGRELELRPVIKSRDREIAPTEEGLGIKKSRDREIAPTEEGLGIKKSRDREIAPTEDRKRSGIGVASYKVIKSRDREIAPTEEGWVSIK